MPYGIQQLSIFKIPMKELIKIQNQKKIKGERGSVSFELKYKLLLLSTLSLSSTVIFQLKIIQFYLLN